MSLVDTKSPAERRAQFATAVGGLGAAVGAGVASLFRRKPKSPGMTTSRGIGAPVNRPMSRRAMTASRVFSGPR